MQEFLDIVDEKNNFTGETADKSYIHNNGIWHREVACWLMNRQGEVLVQKRALNKEHAPGKWDIAAGHVKTKEKAKSAMIRELKEEIGININQEDIELLMVVKRHGITTKNNTFQYHYFAYTDRKIEEYDIQKEEVEEIKYISLLELERIIVQKDEEYTFAKRRYIRNIYRKLKEKLQKNGVNDF